MFARTLHCYEISYIFSSVYQRFVGDFINSRDRMQRILHRVPEGSPVCSLSGISSGRLKGQRHDPLLLPFFIFFSFTFFIFLFPRNVKRLLVVYTTFDTVPPGLQPLDPDGSTPGYIQSRCKSQTPAGEDLFLWSLSSLYVQETLARLLR